MLHILMHGKSWYNSHGFVSDNYRSEIVLNKPIINQKMSSFLESIIAMKRQVFLDEMEMWKKLMEKYQSETQRIELKRYEARIASKLLNEYKTVANYDQHQRSLADLIIPEPFILEFKTIFDKCWQNADDEVKFVMTCISKKYINQANTSSLSCDNRMVEILKEVLRYAAYLLTYDPVVVLEL